MDACGGQAPLNLGSLGWARRLGLRDRGRRVPKAASQRRRRSSSPSARGHLHRHQPAHVCTRKDCAGMGAGSCSVIPPTCGSGHVRAQAAPEEFDIYTPPDNPRDARTTRAEGEIVKAPVVHKRPPPRERSRTAASFHSSQTTHDGRTTCTRNNRGAIK